MAIGLGLMMGFRFMENFNQPYISQSITEFWRRWHISLSTWLRDYLYISLGGNRGTTFQTYRNLFLTMLLGGLWHGANFTYIIWGAWHGAWLAIERALGVDAAPKVINPLRWAFTFLLVVIGWVIFRAENLDVAWRMYAAMFSFGELGLSELNRAQLTSLQIATLVLAYVVLAWFGIRQFHAKPLTGAPKARADEHVDANGPATAQPRSPQAAADDPAAIAYSPSGALVWQQTWMTQLPVLATRVALLLLFAASILKLSAQSFSPFLYFQF